MKNVAIIGFGWLGTELGISLQKLGYNIIGSTTRQEKLKELQDKNLEAFVLNSRDFNTEELKNRFYNVNIAIITIPPSREQAEDVRVYGENLLNIAKLFSVSTKFIFTSSTTVYHNDVQVATEEGLNREDFIDKDNVLYAEYVLDAYLKERLTIVRLSGLIGGGRHIGKYFAGRKGIAQGTSPVNLIHQIDCVRLISSILEQGIWGEVFNACASEHPTRGDYYTAYCREFGLELPEFNMDQSQAKTKVISNEKSKAILDFEYELDNPYYFFKLP